MPVSAVDTVLCYIRKWARRPADDALSDGQLIERFLTLGEEAAFAELVQRHGRLVHNVCLRILGNVHDAEDAFQATFFILARKASAIRKRQSVASWLYGVAYRVAVRAKRRAPLRDTVSTEGIDMAQPDPANQAAWRELQPLLDGELERLPEKYQAPLVLCYFEGKSNEEAARLLHWPVGTVKGRLARARSLLRQRLARRGLLLPSATVVALLSGQATAAPLPSSLVDSTVKATMVFVAGSAPPVGCISAQAVALTRGELHAMFTTKLKVLSVVALLTGVSAWTTMSGYRAWADKPQAAVNPTSATIPVADAPKATSFEGRWTAKLEADGKTVALWIELQHEGNQWKGTVRLSKNQAFEMKKLKVTGAKISFDCEADEADLSLTGELKDGVVLGTFELLSKKEGLTEGTWSMSRR